MSGSQFFEMRRDGDVLVVTPLANFAALGDTLVASEWSTMREAIDGLSPPRVVIDMSKLPVFGSTVLEWMVQVWRRCRDGKGAMMVASLTPISREVIAVTKLDSLWKMADSVEVAVTEIRQASEG
jgi:anti-anti-sigma factor